MGENPETGVPMQTVEIDLRRIRDEARLAALKNTELLDSPPEDAFDRLVRLASAILDTPVALVSLVDDHRQFFKAAVGLPEPWASKRETPLSHSFCKLAVATGEPLIVNDARRDPRVASNLAVPDLGVVAYAGVPLASESGQSIGVLCVIDTKPREWPEDRIALLHDLAVQVMTEIALRNQIRQHERLDAELIRKQKIIDLLEDVAETAGASRDSVDATRNVLHLLCSRFEWMLGQAHLVSPGSDPVLYASATCLGELPRFVKVFRETHFEGMGLPEKALAAGAAVWLDIPPEESLTDEGGDRIRSGIAFPVIVGGRMPAVLEFFSATDIPRERMLADACRSIGIALGLVFEKEQLVRGMKLYRGVSREMRQPLADLTEAIDRLKEVTRDSDDQRLIHFSMIAGERARRLERIESRLEQEERTYEQGGVTRTVRTTDLAEFIRENGRPSDGEGPVIELIEPNESVEIEAAPAVLRGIASLLRNARTRAGTDSAISAKIDRIGDRVRLTLATRRVTALELATLFGELHESLPSSDTPAVLVMGPSKLQAGSSRVRLVSEGDEAMFSVEIDAPGQK